MKTDKKNQRREQIETAAFELLAEEGYEKVSMLKIAKKASASNQTMYAWYGNKQKLFESIIHRSGEQMLAFLTQAIAEEGQLEEVLYEFGIHLLGFITSDEAQIINRAAVIDATKSGILAQAIDTGIRTELIALLAQLMEKFPQTDSLSPEFGGTEMAEIFISLLFGELQFRGTLGLVEPLTSSQIEARSKLTSTLFAKLIKQ